MKDLSKEKKKKEKYGGCMYPGCTEMGVENHHIIFRSETRKTIITEDPRFCVKLCSFHHRLGQDSPHRRRIWREYYKRYLPDNWQGLIDACKTIR